MSDAPDWGAARAAADRIDAGESWEPHATPTPVELARELYQKRGVESATPDHGSDGGRVEIVLSERIDTVPRWIARPIYRRGLAVADVSPIAGHSRLQVTVEAPEGRR